jgi:hypothetical protein
MATTTIRRQWQDKAVLGLGLLLLASPWLLGFASVPAAAWNAYALGAFIVLWAAIGLLIHAYLPMFMIAFGCVWLILSQEILAFTDHVVATAWVVAFGAVTGLVAMWGAVVQARREYAHGAVSATE